MKHRNKAQNYDTYQKKIKDWENWLTPALESWTEKEKERKKIERLYNEGAREDGKHAVTKITRAITEKKGGGRQQGT